MQELKLNEKYPMYGNNDFQVYFHENVRALKFRVPYAFAKYPGTYERGEEIFHILRRKSIELLDPHLFVSVDFDYNDVDDIRFCLSTESNIDPREWATGLYNSLIDAGLFPESNYNKNWEFDVFGGPID